MTSTTDPTTGHRFSVQLREATTGDHRSAEGSGLMRDLVSGALPPRRIGEVFAQHLEVYRALEETAADLAGDPVVTPFLFDGLARTPALEHDVALLLGPDATAPPPSPATTAYAERIRSTATWPGGFVAHHYTRYLGDLSGGQHIGRALARAHPDLDLRFYSFDRVESPAALKDAYRAHLDAAPWSPDERLRIIDEVHVAYDLTSRLLAELDAAPA